MAFEGGQNGGGVDEMEENVGELNSHVRDLGRPQTTEEGGTKCEPYDLIEGDILEVEDVQAEIISQALPEEMISQAQNNEDSTRVCMQETSYAEIITRSLESSVEEQNGVLVRSGVNAEGSTLVAVKNSEETVVIHENGTGGAMELLEGLTSSFSWPSVGGNVTIDGGNLKSEPEAAGQCVDNFQDSHKDGNVVVERGDLMEESKGSLLYAEVSKRASSHDGSVADEQDQKLYETSERSLLVEDSGMVDKDGSMMESLCKENITETVKLTAELEESLSNVKEGFMTIEPGRSIEAAKNKEDSVEETKNKEDLAEDAKNEEDLGEEDDNEELMEEDTREDDNGHSDNLREGLMEEDAKADNNGDTDNGREGLNEEESRAVDAGQSDNDQEGLIEEEARAVESGKSGNDKEGLTEEEAANRDNNGDWVKISEIQSWQLEDAKNRVLKEDFMVVDNDKPVGEVKAERDSLDLSEVKTSQAEVNGLQDENKDFMELHAEKSTEEDKAGSKENSKEAAELESCQAENVKDLSPDEESFPMDIEKPVEDGHEKPLDTDKSKAKWQHRPCQVSSKKAEMSLSDALKVGDDDKEEQEFPGTQTGGTDQVDKGVIFGKQEEEELMQSGFSTPPVQPSRKKKRRRSSGKDSSGILTAIRNISSDHKFSVGDLVWGKVKSHPWWPGHIFDPSDASLSARKHFLNDRLLVAFLGDGTFGWCEASQLVPFDLGFTEFSGQTNAKAFRKAVACALDEVGRRVELGLMCACHPKAERKELEKTAVRNSGIKEGAVVNKHSDVTEAPLSFDSRKFLKGLQELVKSPLMVRDLDMTIVCAQAAAFTAFKGLMASGKIKGETSGKEIARLDAQELPHTEDSEQTHLSPAADEQSNKAKKSGEKSKRNSDTTASRPKRTKKRSIEDLIVQSGSTSQETGQGNEAVMELPGDVPNDGMEMTEDQNKRTDTVASMKEDPSEKMGWVRKRLKTHLEDDIDKTPSSKSKKVNVGDAVDVKPDSDKQDKQSLRKSLTLGECIKKIAGEITSVPPSSKKGASSKSLAENGSNNELHGNLLTIAKDPLFWAKKTKPVAGLKDYFLQFRDSTFEKSSTKPKGTGHSPKSKTAKSPKERAAAESSEDISPNSSKKNSKRKADSAPTEVQERRKRTKRLVSIQQSEEFQKTEEEETEDFNIKQYTRRPSASKLPAKEGTLVDEKPANLFMKFPKDCALPSKRDLKSKFSKFGQLDVSETRVFTSSGCAQVAFKSRSAAEEAFNFASDNSIFGSAKVSFRLRFPSEKTNEDMGAENEEDFKDTTDLLTSSASKDSSLPIVKADNKGESQLLLIQQNLEMMTSMLSQSTQTPEADGGNLDTATEDAKADIRDEMVSLLQKVTALVSQQS